MSRVQVVAEVGDTVDAVAAHAEQLLGKLDVVQVVHNGRVVEASNVSSTYNAATIARDFDRIQAAEVDASKAGVWTVVTSEGEVEAIFKTEIEAMRYAVEAKYDARFQPFGEVS